MPAFLLRVDLLAVYKNIQRPRRADTQVSGQTQFTFYGILEAHGLHLDIASEEAAFDLDLHTPGGLADLSISPERLYLSSPYLT